MSEKKSHDTNARRKRPPRGGMGVHCIMRAHRIEKEGKKGRGSLDLCESLFLAESGPGGPRTVAPWYRRPGEGDKKGQRNTRPRRVNT
jgi:hypothetical protein